MSETVLDDKVLRMKEGFDAAFALPEREDSPGFADLLAIRTGGDGYALRISDISGLASDRKIIPVPGSAASFLGIAGIRGTLVPVWDLGAILGYQGLRRGARWLARGTGSAAWALAFEGFEGYFRVPMSEIRAGSDHASEYTRESCTLGGSVRPVVSLPSVLETLNRISESNQTTRR